MQLYWGNKIVVPISFDLGTKDSRNDSNETMTMFESVVVENWYKLKKRVSILVLSQIVGFKTSTDLGEKCELPDSRKYGKRKN